MQMNFGERVERKALRLSKMGPICPKHLWFSVHKPELAEPFTGQTIFKFAYGHTVEAMAIALAKAAGHEVTGEQDELVVNDVKGHRDCVLDGHIVDVKSCSSRMFERIARKALAFEDDFGYLDQLDGYMVGSIEDDLVRVKDIAFIWAINKETGAMSLYEHHLRKAHILARVANHKAVVASPVPPACTCETVEDGKSGNYILGVKGSYSQFKYECNPDLRCFLYSGGPRYFTRVVKRPVYKGVPLVEIDRRGRHVYN